MIQIYVENRQDEVEVNEELNSLLREAVMRTLMAEGWSRPETALEVGITLVDDAQIRELNREYRRQDRPTDVLSFPLSDREELASAPTDQPVLLGDVVISLPTARRQAEEYGHSFQREVAFLAVHGLLHLLGYDHESEGEEREMFSRQEAILSGMGLGR